MKVVVSARINSSLKRGAELLKGSGMITVRKIFRPMLMCMLWVAASSSAVPSATNALQRAESAASVVSVKPGIPTEGLRLWLKADAGIIKDRNGHVSFWKDQSGRGFDLKQKDVTKQPLFVADAMNKQPALQFDGAENILETQHGVDLLDRKKMKATPPAVSLFVVVSPGLRQWDHADILDYEHEAHANFVLQQVGSQTNVFSLGGEGVQLLAPNVFQIFSGYLDQKTYRCFLNGSYRRGGPQTPWQVISPRHFSVGCKSLVAIPRYFNGVIAEILIYNRVLRDQERQAVEATLSKKYGIEIEK